VRKESGIGMKIALTIAGSDSGGGAGIQADLKTFHQFGVFGTSVIVAVTAQNTLGVRDVYPIPGRSVDAQLAALAEDLAPHAVKTGMLATADLVRRVAAALRTYRWEPYVLDPVMVASSGDRLLTTEAESAVRDELVPLATLVTPNLSEAAMLSGRPVRDEETMHRAGEALLDLGAGAVLVKGGHLPGAALVDLLVTRQNVRRFPHQRIPTRATHGTGCTLSAAITAGLALGRPLEQATATALDYLQRAIASAPGLGAGHGPVDHGVAAITPSTIRPSRSPT
jgi:hydroxymethylpyrimidine/phosphomethylpyrimidine kinase